jgi:hypothetical protein
LKFLRNLLLPILIFVVGYLWVGNGLSQWQLSEWIKVPLAFIVVLAPGGIIAVKLYGRLSWLHFIVYGFPTSIAIIGILGLLARTLHWSIEVISFIWFVFFIICVLWLIWTEKNIFPTSISISGNWVTSIWVILSLITLTIFAYVSIVLFSWHHDTFIYGAEVTYFGSGFPLDWKEIYFDTGNLISDRFFLSYWPLFQALVVHISGIHILQAHLILGAIIIYFLGGAIYVLGCELGFSLRLSLLMMIFSFICYAILTKDSFQSGSLLLRATVQDKELAEFIFFPMAISVTYKLSISPSRRLYTLLFLILVGIMFTHPIGLGLTVLVISGWMMLSIITTRNFYPYANILLLSIILLIPLIIIRIITQSAQLYDFGSAPVSYGFVLWVSEDKQLYAPTVKSTGILSYLILVLGGLISLTRINRHMNRLILAISIVIGIGLLPYTSMFYGRLIGTENIWRNVWILPYGLFVLSILVAISGILHSVIAKFRVSLFEKPSVNFAIILFVFFISPIFIIDQLPENSFNFDLHRQFNRYDELIEITDYIEVNHGERVIVLGNEKITYTLPTLSYISKTMMFVKRRQMVAFSGLNRIEAIDRENRQKEFFSTATPEEQLNTLVTYDVDYILYETKKYQDFIDSLLNSFPELFELEMETDKYRLLRYIPQT